MKSLARFASLLMFPLLIGAGCPSGQVSSTPSETPAPTPAVSSSKPEPVAVKYVMPEIWSAPSVLSPEEIEGKQARITTEYGDIVFDLFADTAPLTVSNFVYLSNAGYYNGLTFHRRVEQFVIQGGDPVGNGTGGPGYRFADELTDPYSYDRGIVAMANSGKDTNGSQFFIMLADNPLPKNYSIFGRVTSGMDVVDKIQVGDVMSKVVIENK